MQCKMSTIRSNISCLRMTIKKVVCHTFIGLIIAATVKCTTFDAKNLSKCTHFWAQHFRAFFFFLWMLFTFGDNIICNLMLTTAWYSETTTFTRTIKNANITNSFCESFHYVFSIYRVSHITGSLIFCAIFIFMKFEEANLRISIWSEFWISNGGNC